MIGLIQRVAKAKITIEDQSICKIKTGLLVLVAVQPNDNEDIAERLAKKISTYRIFPDEKGRMNKSITDKNYELMLVPQFTLAADTAKGARPSFTHAANPETGKKYFDLLYKNCIKRVKKTYCGVFGEYMKISLTNDGPATFWLEVN